MKLPGTAKLAFCLALPLYALKMQGQAATTQNRPQNIAVVSFNALVLQTNEAHRDLGALEAKFAPRQSQLQVLNGEIESSRKELADNGDKLSDQERASRAQALSAKEKQLERSTEDFRNDSQAEGQEAFQKIAQEVFAFMQEYARQHGHDRHRSRAGFRAGCLVRCRRCRHHRPGNESLQCEVRNPCPQRADPVRPSKSWSRCSPEDTIPRCTEAVNQALRQSEFDFVSLCQAL
jgi:outer membrane protein